MEASPASAADPPAGPRLRTLWGLLALALGVRLFAWSRTYMIFNDGADFLWQSERLLEGHLAAALSHPYHPLYPALTALGTLVTGDLVLGGLGVSLLGGLLSVLASWGIARRVLPEVPAAPAAAALVAATCARIVHVTSDVQSDGLFAGLCLMALWGIVSAATRDGCRRSLAAAGLFTGLAYLTRPEGLYMVVPLGLWIGAAIGRPGQLVPRLSRSLVFAGCLTLLVVPYVLTLHTLTGVWGLSLKPSLQIAGLRGGDEIHLAPPGSPLAIGFIPRSREWRAAQQQRGSSETEPAQAKTEAPLKKGAVLASEPWDRATTDTLRQVVRTVRLELWLLAIPGMVMLSRRRRGLTIGLALTVLGWIAASIVQMRLNGYVTNRHLLLAVIMLVPVAGLGLVGMWSWGRVCQLLAVLALAEAVDAGVRHRRPDNGPRLEALAWVTENTTPDQLFLTHRRRDGYYAQRDAIPTRMPCDEDVLARRVAQDDVPFLVYDLEKVERFHPDWLTDGRVHEVRRFEGDGDTVLILEPRFAER